MRGKNTYGHSRFHFVYFLFTDQQQVFTEHPRGYWNHETMRAFMENIARRHHMDPLDPDTWYTIPAESIYQSKVIRKEAENMKRSCTLNS